MPVIYKRSCNVCGNYYVGEGEQFCSHKCSNARKFKRGWYAGMVGRRILKDKKCLFCNQMFHPRIQRRKYCSKNCVNKMISETRIGVNHPNYKRGFVKGKNGYLYCSCGENKHRLLHRIIYEKHIGRKLQRNEIIHHINGDKIDNRIENLQLIDNSEHSRRHANVQWGASVEF